MSEITITGDSREAALMAIVATIAFGEGLDQRSMSITIESARFNRAWLAEAFAFARDCLDGPKPGAAMVQGFAKAGET